MKCAYHPDRDAVWGCTNCRKLLCEECEVTCNKCGVILCQECVEVVNGKNLCRNCALPIKQKEGLNWFQRHLNWSLVLVTIGVFFVGLAVGSLFGYTTPELSLLSYESIEWITFFIGVIISLAVFIPFTIWFLRRKGRSLGWVGMLFVPFGLIVLLCLRNHLTRNAKD